jgi:hypothetical protein
MLTNLLKDLCEIGLVIGSEGDMKVRPLPHSHLYFGSLMFRFV